MNIDFMGRRVMFGLGSVALVIASLIIIATKGINRSVDFAGGTQITVNFADENVDIGQLRDKVSKVDDKAIINDIQAQFGSEFSVKIKNPEVEEGQETEASNRRRRGLERAFAEIENEQQVFLELMNQIALEDLELALVQENPYGLSDKDATVEATYKDVAQKIKTELPSAATLRELAEKVGGPQADKLEAGLVLAFPALNRTTPDLLNALMMRRNPLNRDKGVSYSDIAKQIMEVRTQNGDFIPDFDTLFAKLSVSEGEDLAVLKDFLRNNFTLGRYNITSNETFSPSIAAELLGRAWEAIVLAMIGILFYISIRFTLGYAIASVVALAHDVIIALGAFSLVGAELSNPVVAAFLTIVGYSLNDTIVIFDRIRDNLRKERRPDVLKLMNSSINETLSRTVVTSLTTLMVILVIYLGANATLRDFAFPLLIGIVVGTYSSIFVASPALHFWHRKFKPIAT